MGLGRSRRLTSDHSASGSGTAHDRAEAPKSQDGTNTNGADCRMPTEATGVSLGSEAHHPAERCQKTGCYHS
jgi:hypothetical protein